MARNWVQQTGTGHLPHYVKRIEKHIRRSRPGLTDSQYIAMAVSQMKKFAAQGHPRAVAALAEWEAKKVEAHAIPNKRGKHKVNLSTPMRLRAKSRKKAAKEGKALPGGRFPVRNKAELSDAVRAIGRAKPEDKAKIKAFIRKRAKKLGAKGTVPETWKGKDAKLSADRTNEAIELAIQRGWVTFTENVVDLAAPGKKYRYKHGWILVNPGAGKAKKTLDRSPVGRGRGKPTPVMARSKTAKGSTVVQSPASAGSSSIVEKARPGWKSKISGGKKARDGEIVRNPQARYNRDQDIKAMKRASDFRRRLPGETREKAGGKPDVSKTERGSTVAKSKGTTARIKVTEGQKARMREIGDGLAVTRIKGGSNTRDALLKKGLIVKSGETETGQAIFRLTEKGRGLI